MLGTPRCGALAERQGRRRAPGHGACPGRATAGFGEGPLRAPRHRDVGSCRTSSSCARGGHQAPALGSVRGQDAAQGPPSRKCSASSWDDAGKRPVTADTPLRATRGSETPPQASERPWKARASAEGAVVPRAPRLGARSSGCVCGAAGRAERDGGRHAGGFQRRVVGRQGPGHGTGRWDSPHHSQRRGRRRKSTRAPGCRRPPGRHGAGRASAP